MFCADNTTNMNVPLPQQWSEFVWKDRHCLCWSSCRIHCIRLRLSRLVCKMKVFSFSCLLFRKLQTFMRTSISWYYQRATLKDRCSWRLNMYLLSCPQWFVVIDEQPIPYGLVNCHWFRFLFFDLFYCCVFIFALWFLFWCIFFFLFCVIIFISWYWLLDDLKKPRNLYYFHFTF